MNRCLALVLSLTGSAAAQTFTGNVATVGSLQASFGTQVQSSALPVGPMGGSGALLALAGSATSGFAHADVGWSFTQDVTQSQFTLLHSVGVSGLAGAASFGPGDFLLTLQAATPTSVLLELSHHLVIAQGMVMPTLQVDIGDDGSIEFASGQVSPPQVPLTVGPAGVPVRVRTQIALNAPGDLISNVTLRAVPSHTIVQTVVAACPLPDLQVLPHWNGDVSLQGGTFSNDPWLPVIGLSVQPTLLPHPPFACLLLPAPDFVLWQPFRTLYTIPVPATLRPLTFWTQAVTVTPIGLRTSAAFRVDAL